MRTITSFLRLLFLCLPVLSWTQHALTREFGISYDGVVAFLKEKGITTFNQDRKDTLLIYDDNGYYLTYYFNEDKLYKILIFRNVYGEKDATTTMEAFHNFLELKKANFVIDEKTYIAAMEKDNMHEMYKRKLSKYSYQIKLVYWSMTYQPGEPTNEDHHEVETEYYSMLFR